MTVIFSHLGLRTELDDSAVDWVTIHLYKNDVTPTIDSVVGDFTEADFDGYASAALVWGAATDVTPEAQIQADPYVSTAGGGLAGPQDIYGYYVLNGAGQLMYAERDPAAPVTISSPGQSYPVLPRVREKNYD